MLVQKIGKTIQQRRKSLKITQPDLAELAGVATNTLYKIERGLANPTLDIIEKIIAVLGMEIKMEVKSIINKSGS